MTKERQEDLQLVQLNFDQLLRNNSTRRLMARYPALHQFVRYLLEKDGQKKALLLDTEGAAVQDIYFTQVKGDDTKNYSPLYSQVERFIELRTLLSHPPPQHIKKWTHLETLQQANATIKNLQKVQDKRAANFSSVQIKVPTVIFRATERDRASPFQANPSGPPTLKEVRPDRAAGAMLLQMWGGPQGKLSSHHTRSCEEGQEKAEEA
ncbi:hypothetical protein Bbelb_291640 [Branchiostoma belcheri]|nr:hypothetical protein Bbelb_291640 [Branchiostoma belcheri]